MYNLTKHISITLIIFFSNCRCIAQQSNSSNGFIVIKVNASIFKDNDDKRFENAGIKPTSVNYPLPILTFAQNNYKLAIFPGVELDYYFPRSKFVGMNIGITYCNSKTNYDFFYKDQIYVGNVIPQKEYTQKIGYGVGNGVLKNQIFKFIYGFNFNTKFGLNIFLQPLNPEFRFYSSKYSVSYSTYNTYLYTAGTNTGKDSTSILVNTEIKSIDFQNYKTHINASIAFPSLIGVEQKFKIGKLTYLAGASVAASFLEQYVIYRAHIGVCFGNFKRNTQPGY